MLALLLAPPASVWAGVCHCDAMMGDLANSADSSEISPIPCCQGFERCCYEQKELHESTLLLANLNQQSSADLKIAVRQTVQRLPAPVAAVALEQSFVKCADPPDTGVSELSLHQSWLI